MPKLFLPTVLLLISLSHVQAQTVEDFFLPEAPNNKVDYSTPGSSKTTSTYYFVKDSMLIIKDSTFVQGKFESAEVKTIHFINNEVHLIRSEFFFKTWPAKVTDYNPAQIILKIPAQNESIDWTSNDPDKGTIKYNASWQEVMDNNTKYTLLRVEKSFDFTSVKEVDYYVKDVGLLKTEVLVGGSGMKKLQFEGMTHVPDLN